MNKLKEAENLILMNRCESALSILDEVEFTEEEREYYLKEYLTAVSYVSLKNSDRAETIINRIILNKNSTEKFFFTRAMFFTLQAEVIRLKDEN